MSNELVNGGGFDIASIGLERTESGSPWPLLHPKTKAPLLNPDKTPITITLLGQYSEAFREDRRQCQIARGEFVDVAVKNDPKLVDKTIPLPRDFLERWDTSLLVACTTDWSFTSMDGQPFPCTMANAARFWADSRFWRFREPAVAFIMEDGNFLAEESIILSGTPDISSGSTSRSPLVEP